jgi:hypothetical protein
VREFRSLGSVRGAPRNGRPYREQTLSPRLKVFATKRFLPSEGFIRRRDLSARPAALLAMLQAPPDGMPLGRRGFILALIASKPHGARASPSLSRGYVKG